MAKQIIQVGTIANDKTGDPLRSAFTKINQNFTELYDGAGGNANTGNITFEGIAIVGDTTDLPQGSIELVPNDGVIPDGQPNEGDLYTSWGQYLRIYPTWNADAPHIHITAGSGENSNGDLFLGDDSKYVQVNHDGTVSISTNTNLWEFDTVGDLNLPDNGGIVFDRANTTIRVGMGFHIASGEGISLDAIDETDPENLVYKSWYFSPTGSTYFPTLTVPISDNANPSGTGQTLKFGDTSQQAIIYGPESTSGNNSAERIIIQGAPGYEGTSGEGGDVYLWAGPGGDANGNGGDIKVRAGRGDGSGAGGYLNFQAGDSSTGNGGYINIESGQSTYGLGGDITIWAHDGGDIKLRTHNNVTSQEWLFGANGSVTFPDSTVQETAWAGGRVVTVPGSSIGITGDEQGDIAFNSSYIYYCTQDFIEASYSSTITVTYSGSFPSIVKGSIPQPQAGWELIYNGDTYILDSNATELNPGEWVLPLTSSISVTAGDSITIGPASPANIWKRVAWSNDTW